jgi:ubiquitin carboxyl-terminal hydrolase 4/11/15
LTVCIIISIGHYTAYAKNLVDDKWYNLDDSSVSQVQPERAITQAAYVLFYRRRSRTIRPSITASPSPPPATTSTSSSTT